MFEFLFILKVWCNQIEIANKFRQKTKFYSNKSQGL